MRMSLILDGLWDCVKGVQIDNVKDQRALAKICLSVKRDVIYAHVRYAATSKEAWENLEKVCEEPWSTIASSHAAIQPKVK